jgi:hypothetical protein
MSDWNVAQVVYSQDLRPRIHAYSLLKGLFLMPTQSKPMTHRLNAHYVRPNRTMPRNAKSIYNNTALPALLTNANACATPFLYNREVYLELGDEIPHRVAQSARERPLTTRTPRV